METFNHFNSYNTPGYSIQHLNGMNNYFNKIAAEYDETPGTAEHREYLQNVKNIILRSQERIKNFYGNDALCERICREEDNGTI